MPSKNQEMFCHNYYSFQIQLAVPFSILTVITESKINFTEDKAIESNQISEYFPNGLEWIWNSRGVSGSKARQLAATRFFLAVHGQLPRSPGLGPAHHNLNSSRKCILGRPIANYLVLEGPTWLRLSDCAHGMEYYSYRIPWSLIEHLTRPSRLVLGALLGALGPWEPGTWPTKICFERLNCEQQRSPEKTAIVVPWLTQGWHPQQSRPLKIAWRETKA